MMIEEDEQGKERKGRKGEERKGRDAIGIAHT